MWHYAVGTERKGPVGQTEIEGLATAGTIGGGTLVWREGMADWLPASQTELVAFLSAVAIPDPIPYVEGRTYTGDSAPWQGPAPTETPESLGTLFTTCWVGVIATVVITIGTIAAAFSVWRLGGPLPGAGVVVGLTLLCISLTAVPYCKLLYRMWEQVSDGSARTTPSRAVGFMFIPLFNFYWQFVALYGLALEMNRVIDVHRIPVRRPNANRVLWYCILTLPVSLGCMGALSPLGVIFGAVASFSETVRAARAILAWRLAHTNSRA